MRRGLVLQGGGAKGAWQFGVLQAFADHGLQFDVIAGTSVGSLNGAIWSSGRMDIGEEMWSSMRLARVFSWRMWLLPLVGLQIICRPFYAIVQGYAPAGSRAGRMLYTLAAIVMALPPISAFWASLSALNIHDPDALFIGVTKQQWIIAGSVALTLLWIVWFARAEAASRRAEFWQIGVFAWIMVVGSFTADLLISKAPCGPLCDLTIWVGAIPLVLLGAAWCLRASNVSILAPRPLEATIRGVLSNPLRVPLFATTAIETGSYFDPDHLEYSAVPDHRGETMFYSPVPRAALVAIYARVDMLGPDAACEALLASSALPLGIAPARFDRDWTRSVDGGVVDNTPWFPLVEVSLRRARDRSLQTGREMGRRDSNTWQVRDRLKRVLQLRFVARNALSDESVESSPPRSLPLRQPARWPKVVVIAPKRPLGSFVTGTMNFSTRTCRRRLADGYAAGTNFLPALNRAAHPKPG
jgi:hypothetical protein